MATHPTSPYANLAPRPRSPPFYPSIPAAASFLASYYAVPLRLEPDSREEELDVRDEKEDLIDGGEILGASAFLGHQGFEEPGGVHEADGRDEGVLRDVRALLFPGQRFGASSYDSTNNNDNDEAGNDRGVYEDHTWSVDRGWTGRESKDPQRTATQQPEGEASLDINYLTNRLGNIITDPQPSHQTPQSQGPSARLIRRESSNASRSLSRQSSVRRGQAVVANPEQEREAEDETPMSPASAFLSHFSPPHTHAQAVTIPRPVDPDTTSGFSLSRIGSPTKYGQTEGVQYSGVQVMGPLLAPDHPDTHAPHRRSFSTSTSSAGWLSAAYPVPPPGGTSHMTMSTISSSSGISHHHPSSGAAGSSTAPPDAAGSRVMGYTLGKVIGRGGFSTVRMAIDERTGERYACRIIKRDDLSDQSGSLENFEIELEIWEEVSRVRYPRILPLLEKWRDPEGYATYLITPLMARGSLLDVIRREGTGEETARKWFPGIVEAVKALHCGWTGIDKDGKEAHAQGGYLHGDLKLDNFLVGEHGEICVCDFGLAQRLGVKASGAGEEKRGRKEERRIILHSREASPERLAAGSSHGTPTTSRHPSRSRPKFHSPYVSTTEVDLFHHHQHVARPSMPSFPVTSQLLHEHHRPSHSRGRDVSPTPGKARRASRSRTRRTAPPHIPVQTFPSASLPYACPELLRAPPSPPDFAQDIWALGIILHALLTSRLPFVDAFDPRLQMKIIRGEWTVPPGLGDEWTECLMGCLEVDPRRRWDIETLAASDAVQGWQEAKSRSKSRSRSRARGRSRIDLSPTDRMSSGSRGADSIRARSRSRNRTDYFGHDHTMTAATATASTPRTGRTRSRSNPVVAKLREPGGYSHYDSPLEQVPEIEQQQADPAHAPTPLLGTSPTRSRSSQSRHVLGTFARRDTSTGESTASSRNGSAGRSRSRDPVTSVRTGDVPAPRASPARNRSRAGRMGDNVPQ